MNPNPLSLLNHFTVPFVRIAPAPVFTILVEFGIAEGSIAGERSVARSPGNLTTFDGFGRTCVWHPSWPHDLQPTATPPQHPWSAARFRSNTRRGYSIQSDMR